MITATEERAGALGYVGVPGGLYGDVLQALEPDAEELRHIPHLVHALGKTLRERPKPDGRGSWSDVGPGQVVWLATARVRAGGAVPAAIQKKWRNSDALHELLAQRALVELRAVAKGTIEPAREAHQARMERSSGAHASTFDPQAVSEAFVYFTIFPEGTMLPGSALPPSYERARHHLHQQGRSGPSGAETAYDLWLGWTGLQEAGRAWRDEMYAVAQARDAALRASTVSAATFQKEQQTKVEQALADAAEHRQEKARAARARKAPVVVRLVEPEPEEEKAFDVLSKALTVQASEGHQVVVGGVRKQGPGHFKSLRSVVCRAFVVAGGTAASFERAIQRGALEILDIIPGQRHGDDIIEYVFHNDLSF